MTSIDSSSRPPAAREPSRPGPNGTPRPEPADVRAMSDAFDAARGRMERGPIPGGKKFIQGQARTGGEQVSERAPTGQPTQRGPIRHETKQEGNEALAGWTGGGGVTVPGVVAADVTAPHADPGAFAQMLADLWTRENGKGAKEVLVRFGNRSWPATGARLVRNAAGGLDVALLVGDGGRAYGDRLPQLETALADAGVNLGSLELSTDI